MTLEKNSSGAVVGPIVALVVVFRLAGKHGDIEDLLSVAAPRLLVTDLAVGGADDFVG